MTHRLDDPALRFFEMGPLFNILCVLILLFAMPVMADDDWPSSRIQEVVTKGHSVEDPPEILLHEALDSELLAVFSKGTSFAPEESYAFDFISKPLNRLVRLTEVRDRPGSVSWGGSWGLSLAETVNGTTTGKSRKLSAIWGRVPFDGYTAIEISWNCKVPERKALGGDGYFYFWRPGHNWRRCNVMHLFDAQGEKFVIERDTSGQWVPVKAE